MKKYLGNKAMIILFIAPVMLFMIVMVFYPLVVLMRNSFTTWDGLNPATFNGIKNYVRLFKDPLFYTGLLRGDTDLLSDTDRDAACVRRKEREQRRKEIFQNCVLYSGSSLRDCRLPAVGGDIRCGLRTYK